MFLHHGRLLSGACGAELSKSSKIEHKQDQNNDTAREAEYSVPFP